jgi:hypothetical protein
MSKLPFFSIVIIAIFLFSYTSTSDSQDINSADNLFENLLKLMGEGGTFKNEPDGFRNIKWDTDISTLKDMIIIENSEPAELWLSDMKAYRKKNDELKIGDAKLESVAYLFHKDKFEGAFIVFYGSSNWDTLKEATFEKFGKGMQTNKFKEEYIWIGNKTVALLYYYEITEKGFLMINSMKSFVRMLEAKKEAAKKGAQSGF